MSTLEELKNAPVGSIARLPNTANIMVKGDPDLEYPWTDLLNAPCTSEEIADLGFSLDPMPTPAPTSAREALDLAWSLAHPVKEGQVIPEGTWVMHADLDDDGAMEVYKTGPGILEPHKEVGMIRTIDPLPAPLPKWTKAPAVLARHKDSHDHLNQSVWAKASFDSDRWVTGIASAHWSNLRNVTPLWPKGQDE